jgi:hypothetical protein
MARGSLIAAIGLAWFLLAAPQMALGDVLFAAPADRVVRADCSSAADACDLQQAVETDSNPGDEVVVLSGLGPYLEAADKLLIDGSGSQNVHGQTGTQLPVISFTTPSACSVCVMSGARVGRLDIESSGPQDGLLAQSASGTPTLEQLLVHTTGAGNAACEVDDRGTLRDSLCWAEATDAVLGTRFAASSTVVNLRNLTAISETNDGLVASASTGQTTVTVRNMIAMARNPSSVDVAANAAGGTVTVNIGYSNFDSRAQTPNATVTSPAANNNQTAAPQFVNAATGNFHQKPSSPTIDHGVANVLNGSLDIDGNARALDGNGDCVMTVDIGADEFVDSTPPDCSSGPLPVAQGPETTIDKGPKKKTRKRKAKFRFSSDDPGATFACKLDKQDFEPCTSPQKYKKLKRRKHTFQVRAIDAAGNFDASPDALKWKVKKKKR